jgi:hypothetical protein
LLKDGEIRSSKFDLRHKLARYPAAVRRLPWQAAALAAAIAIAAAACSSSATTAIAPSSSKCAISLAAAPASLGHDGGTGTVTVTTTGECAWTATSDANWLADVAPAAGQGNGQVEFRVAANPGATARVGDIVVNASRIQVRQEASACGWELATRSQSFSETGGSGTAALTATADGCSWTAISNVNWITITAGGSGAGSGSINFRVQANSGPERSGSLTIAGQAFTVTQAAAVTSPCLYALNPGTQAISAVGGAGTPVAVSTSQGCVWTASAAVSWITVTGSPSGNGSGTIAFSVAANTGAARSGMVSVTSGDGFTVSQAGAPAPPPCAYTVNPGNQSIAAAGGTAAPIAVGTTQGCAWTAIPQDSWIAITGGSTGTGSGTVNLRVAANNGGPRNGSLTVAGHAVAIQQAGACSYSISPASKSIDGVGGVGTVSVSTAAGCEWTSLSNEPWIRVTAGSSGSGSGSVAFLVLPNDDKKAKKRDGTITIAGRTFTVSQSN